MANQTTVVIRFKDLDTSESANNAPIQDVRDHLEERCRHLSQTFPETSHYELSIAHDAKSVIAHALVRGKGIDLASHAETNDMRAAAELALERLGRELRREHDTRIFAHRRQAQRSRRRQLA